MTDADARAGATAPVLEVRNLKKHFPVRSGLLRRVRGWVPAVDGVDLVVERPGTAHGLAGESGSGKTTLIRTLLGLIPATAGEVRFWGRDVRGLRGAELQAFRRSVQVVFQDPTGALDPRWTVGRAVAEPLRVHRPDLSEAQRRARVSELLEQVGLLPEHARRYPHELSGGQRQRVVIARALALEPKFLILDEPTSALDVSVQAQILNLLQDLRERLNLTYLLISHDLAVIDFLCERTSVMYRGRIVEEGPVGRVLSKPAHPYTKALIASLPRMESGRLPEPQLKAGGAVPAGGCPLQPRCPSARAVCAQEEPPFVDLGGGHRARCHFAGEV